MDVTQLLAIQKINCVEDEGEGVEDDEETQDPEGSIVIVWEGEDNITGTEVMPTPVRNDRASRYSKKKKKSWENSGV